MRKKQTGTKKDDVVRTNTIWRFNPKIHLALALLGIFGYWAVVVSTRSLANLVVIPYRAFRYRWALLSRWCNG